MSPVRFLHTFNSSLCLVIGTFLNCLLIFLVWRRTCRQVRIYSRILIQTCVVDIYALVIGYLLQPIYFVDNGTPSRTWNGPFHNASTYVHFMVFCLWIIGNFLSSASMTMQFVYRYLLLCRNITISYSVYLALIVIPGIFCVVWMNLIFNFTSGRPPPTKRLFGDSEFYYLLRESTEQEFVEVSVTDAKGNIPCIVGCLTMNFAFYMIIFISSLRIKAFLNSQKDRVNSEFFKQAEHQMNYILAAQAILPTISLIIHTISLSCYLLFPGASIYFLLYLTISVYWLPVLNPLSIILIVKGYRNFLLKLLGGGRQQLQSRVTLTDFSRHLTVSPVPSGQHIKHFGR